MKLKHTIETVYKVNYGDLQKLVAKIYKDKEYSFIETQECGNDTSHEFSVDGKINDYDKSDAENIRKGQIDAYRNYLLMNVLCADGHILPGEYIINVCW